MLTTRTLIALFALGLPTLLLATQDPPAASPSPPASQPVGGDGGGQFRKPAQAEGMDVLLRRQETRPILPTPTRRSSQEPRAADEEGLWPDGSLLVDRTGRVSRSGDRYEFEFAVEGERTPRRLEFLRNQLLELVEEEHEHGTAEFAISAVVTRYRGANFLLLQKVHRRVSNGNLGP